MSEVRATVNSFLVKQKSLSTDKKTIEHWVNIQVSHSVIKWYRGSHEKGSEIADSEGLSEIIVKISEEY